MYKFCGIYSNVSTATDGIMTRYESFESGSCEWYSNLFHTTNDAFVTISLPKGSIVRTMLYSSWENAAFRGKGLTISVGDSYANSTQCFNSTTGLSSWITCNGGLGAEGSNIYMTNTIEIIS